MRGSAVVVGEPRRRLLGRSVRFRCDGRGSIFWEVLVKWSGVGWLGQIILTPFTAVAFEREEVELAAEGSLTVCSDGLDVGGVHLGVAFSWRRVRGGG